ncbi:hypothetical protein BC830DRAFT_1165521 [Chytriomyces sp. MP71]|nr:hypothetical protein BC830DRAFT_1165521 [Chytriomyces sp. MP71]
MLSCAAADAAVSQVLSVRVLAHHASTTRRNRTILRPSVLPVQQKKACPSKWPNPAPPHSHPVLEPDLIVVEFAVMRVRRHGRGGFGFAGRPTIGLPEAGAGAGLTNFRTMRLSVYLATSRPGVTAAADRTAPAFPANPGPGKLEDDPQPPLSRQDPRPFPVPP